MCEAGWDAALEACWSGGLQAAETARLLCVCGPAMCCHLLQAWLCWPRQAMEVSKPGGLDDLLRWLHAGKAEDWTAVPLTVLGPLIYPFASREARTIPDRLARQAWATQPPELFLDAGLQHH